MPNRDQHGNIVMAGRLLDEDPSKFSYEDCVTGWFMVQDITLREHGTVPGFVFVVDMKGTSFAHAARMHISTVKKYYTYIQVGVPNNLNETPHLLRAVSTQTAVMSAVCQHGKVYAYVSL
jgi:hypothetical protein